MFFAEVTPLMRNGRRLAKSERAPSGRYMVTNLECDRDKSNFRRNVVQASLCVSQGTA